MAPGTAALSAASAAAARRPDTESVWSLKAPAPRPSTKLSSVNTVNDAPVVGLSGRSRGRGRGRGGRGRGAAASGRGRGRPPKTSFADTSTTTDKPLVQTSFQTSSYSGGQATRKKNAVTKKQTEAILSLLLPSSGVQQGIPRATPSAAPKTASHSTAGPSRASLTSLPSSNNGTTIANSSTNSLSPVSRPPPINTNLTRGREVHTATSSKRPSAKEAKRSVKTMSGNALDFLLGDQEGKSHSGKAPKVDMGNSPVSSASSLSSTSKFVPRSKGNARQATTLSKPSSFEELNEDMGGFSDNGFDNYDDFEMGDQRPASPPKASKISAPSKSALIVPNAKKSTSNKREPVKIQSKKTSPADGRTLRSTTKRKSQEMQNADIDSEDSNISSGSSSEEGEELKDLLNQFKDMIPKMKKQKLEKNQSKSSKKKVLPSTKTAADSPKVDLESNIMSEMKELEKEYAKPLLAKSNQDKVENAPMDIAKKKWRNSKSSIMNGSTVTAEPPNQKTNGKMDKIQLIDVPSELNTAASDKITPIGVTPYTSEHEPLKESTKIGDPYNEQEESDRATLEIAMDLLNSDKFQHRQAKELEFVGEKLKAVQEDISHVLLAAVNTAIKETDAKVHKILVSEPTKVETKLNESLESLEKQNGAYTKSMEKMTRDLRVTMDKYRVSAKQLAKESEELLSEIETIETEFDRKLKSLLARQDKESKDLIDNKMVNEEIADFWKFCDDVQRKNRDLEDVKASMMNLLEF